MVGLVNFEPGDDERSEVELRLDADPAALATARGAMRDVARATGLTVERTADAALALTEACANVVLHAYPPSRRRVGKPTFVVNIAVAVDAIVLNVCDEGIGMDGSSRRRGLGLGVALIHALADEVSYRTVTGRGTCVRMRFNRGVRAVLG